MRKIFIMKINLSLNIWPLVLTTLVLVSCNESCRRQVRDILTILIPNKDPTPPQVRWEIRNLTNGTTTEFDDEEINIEVPLGTVIEASFIATDSDGGLKIVSLGSSCFYRCINDGIGSALNCLGSSDVIDFSDIVVDRAFKALPMTKTLDIDHTCQIGKFDSGRVDVIGSAENFHAGITTSTISISVVPRK